MAEFTVLRAAPLLLLVLVLPYAPNRIDSATLAVRTRSRFSGMPNPRFPGVNSPRWLAERLADAQKPVDKVKARDYAKATMSKPRSFTFTQLQTVSSLGRGEIRECITRRIISAPADVGQGHHRSYSKWNLVEGVIAAALLRQIRAGAVEQIMNNLRAMLDDQKIDADRYSEAPTRFVYEAIFPSRKDPDERADLLSGEEMGEGAYLLGAVTRQPHRGPLLTRGTPLAAFCRLMIDLDQAVRFVNHMIEAKL